MLGGVAITSVAATSPKPVPEVFHGNWSVDPAYCNFEGDTLDNEMFISANSIGFHATSLSVKSIKVRGDKVIVRYFKLGDATRVPPKVLSLSNDKSKLNNYWHRCPELRAN